MVRRSILEGNFERFLKDYLYGLLKELLYRLTQILFHVSLSLFVQTATIDHDESFSKHQ